METIDLGEGKSARLANLEQARAVLSTPDDFTRRLSPFERSARLKTGKTVTPEQFLAFAARSAREWQPAEIKSVRLAVDAFRSKMQPYTHFLPEQVDLVITSGDEEGGAAYTRGRAIFLPQVRFDRPEADLSALIVHELFHLITRHHPDLHDRLYAAIGFRRCNEIRLPGDLTEREITNPDSPHNCHSIELDWQGGKHSFVPAIYSSTRRYSPLRGGSHFNYLVFRMLGVEEQDGEWHPTIYQNGKPLLAKLEQLKGFYEQVGLNTDYVVQPEEILASNFTLLVLGQRDVPSPELLLKIDKGIKEQYE